MTRVRTIAAMGALALGLSIVPPAAANHYPNHTCGIFPRNPEAGTSGAGFGTPATGAVPATDHVMVEGVCLSLDTHEPFTTFLEVTFQWRAPEGWQDGPTLRCRVLSSGTWIQSATASAPGNCPASHAYGPGDPGEGKDHRARFRLFTNVTNGPQQLGYTAPWATSVSVRGPSRP